MTSNRLVPLIGLCILMLLVFVGMRAWQADDRAVSQLTSVPVAGMPDADSPADTIRTLTAQVAAIKSESEKLSLQNEALLRQKQDIERQLKNQLQEDLKNDYMHRENAMVADLSDLTQQLDFFKTRLDELSFNQNQVQNESENENGDRIESVPVGFGLSRDDALAVAVPAMVWVEPLGFSAVHSADHSGDTTIDTLNDHTTRSIGTITSTGESVLETGAALTNQTEAYLRTAVDDIASQERPVYTVPRNATLIGATGMTALIGRIPINGVVEEPFPFKVIVGQTNLAANGIEMPGLDGMIFSGRATGDWALSCVRGDVDSVTYVFQDGTIRTVSADDNSVNQGNQGNQRNQGNLDASPSRDQNALGWISDRRGIPCVTGARISNTGDFLAGRILAAAAEAAAGAFSQSQVTNTVSGAQGVTTSVITGDSARFAGGQALSGGAREISDYLRERAAQSFDVVYVDTGRELAIHIDTELAIDYLPQGRKTRYVQAYAFDDVELD